MDSKVALPADWSLESEETRYDSMMGREYTSVVYRQENTNQAVRISEVIEPKANTWGFVVHHSGKNGTLGFVEAMTDAKQMAIDFMAEAAEM